MKDDREKIVGKLHKQFCHCSADKLKRLIKASEMWKEGVEILNAADKVTENCQNLQDLQMRSTKTRGWASISLRF